MPQRLPDFEKIEREWYEKLKKEGFEDIEDVKQAERPLKTWHNHFFKQKTTPEMFLAQQTYYQLADCFLVEYKFETKKDRTIWQMHSQGTPLRTIAKKIRMSYVYCHLRVVELRKKMEELRKKLIEEP